MRVLNGSGVIMLNKKFRKDRDKLTQKYGSLDVRTNFRQYGLRQPEILRMDSIGTPWKSNAMQFDSIVCDPPYGFRAPQKVTKKQRKMRARTDIKKEEDQIKNFYNPDLHKQSEILLNFKFGFSSF